MTSTTVAPVRMLGWMPRLRLSAGLLAALLVGGAGGYALGLRGAHTASAAPAPATTTTLRAEVHFSPRGGCTEAVARLIGEARVSVRVQAYGFTSEPIIAALEAAKARGVDVEVVLDRSDAEKTEVGELADAGIPTFIDRAHPIAHDKVTIVDAGTDGAAVETGSFNYTKQGEKNAENCLVLHGPALARAYAAHWAEHRAHAQAFR